MAAPRRWPRPSKPKDAGLFSIISGFDAAYAAYNDFQNAIERWWTLRWLEQNSVAELEATVMKDALVRADTLPLVFRVGGTESLPRGTRVRARVAGVDLLTLELHATLLARLDEAAATSGSEATDESEDDEAGAATGGLKLAIGDDDLATAETAPGDMAPADSAPAEARSDAAA